MHKKFFGDYIRRVKIAKSSPMSPGRKEGFNLGMIAQRGIDYAKKSTKKTLKIKKGKRVLGFAQPKDYDWAKIT